MLSPQDIENALKRLESVKLTMRQEPLSKPHVGIYILPNGLHKQTPNNTPNTSRNESDSQTL